MSKIGHVEIDFHGAAAGTNKNDSIKLDGVDITNCIRGIEIPFVAAGDLLRVTLDVIALPGFHFKGGAWTGVADATAELLITMGWTPPDGSNRLINNLINAFDIHTHSIEHRSHVDGPEFAACQRHPCQSLPREDRAALTYDTNGAVISRHPVGPEPSPQPDTTILNGQPTP